MDTLVDLQLYPLDQPHSDAWNDLVRQCRARLDQNGLFNLPGFLRPEAVATAVQEVVPVLQDHAFTHSRLHNIYFKKSVEGLDANHPALRRFTTINHTICADQMGNNTILRLYEWPELAVFLAAVMDKPKLHPMADPLARANVMAYRDGEALNWHFDRSEFTTTLLLQSAHQGGHFEYRTDLRSDDDPNYDGVARLLAGQDENVRTVPLTAGTLNVFRGKNTAHRVSTIEGECERIIAVYSYYERPGVVFSDEDRIRFYGRAA